MEGLRQQVVHFIVRYFEPIWSHLRGWRDSQRKPYLMFGSQSFGCGLRSHLCRPTFGLENRQGGMSPRCCHVRASALRASVDHAVDVGCDFGTLLLVVLFHPLEPTERIARDCALHRAREGCQGPWVALFLAGSMKLVVSPIHLFALQMS